MPAVPRRRSFLLLCCGLAAALSGVPSARSDEPPSGPRIEYLKARTYHTPIAWEPEELATMSRAVLLGAGSGLRLVPSPGGRLRPGGVWKAEWGDVSASGAYTAPRHLPPGGVDEVTYTDPNGGSASVTVRVTPNPALPGSDLTPVTRVSWATGAAIDPKAPAVRPARTPSYLAVEEAARRRCTVLGPREVLGPLEEYIAVRPLSALTHGGRRLVRLPCAGGGRLESSPLCAVAGARRTPLRYARLAPEAPEWVVATRRPPISRRPNL